MKKVIFLLGLCFIMHTTIYAQTEWHITGNSGTSAATNFVGTTDNRPLVFRTNNAERMRILSTGEIGIGATAPLQKLDVNGNINLRNGFGLFMGNHRVLKVDSANRGTFLGNGSGSVNTGINNTAAGYNALFSGTSGTDNTAAGYAALFGNTTGNYNTAYGSGALVVNQAGSNNTAVGCNALYFNTASFVTAMGYRSLYSNTTGSFNASAGCFSMYNNSTGYSNTAQGYSSMYGNTTGYYNTGTGTLALFANNIGAGNTANGYRALYSNTSGNYNTASGIEALYNNTTGSLNTAVGVDALYNNTTSNYNCAVGYLSQSFANPGYNNTSVGAFTGLATDFDGLFNTIAVGNSTFVTASNQARFGNSSTTSIGGYANWTNISDGRVKKNIKENVPGLAFINKLKPVTYNLDLNAAEGITRTAARKDKDGKPIAPLQQDIDARKSKEQIVYTGFVAQDVEKAAKELNYNFSGVDAAKNDRDLYGLRYAEFVVPLVKSVQELDENQKAEVKSKNEEIAQLKSEIGNLRSEIEELRKAIMHQASGISNQQVSPSASLSTVNAQQSSFALSQNTPNPFSNSTIISCTVPANTANASINFYNQSGALVKTIKVNNAGKNSITIKANEFTAGAYRYVLVAEGKIVDSKTMIIQ